ncbi:MAG TPA: histidine kinase dimerization/phospho-acceptor domain-containing protein [Usitatibacter sp.]|nr:histidine kinase dimerization/phospho-acceptor domain-containing protein [Usitatibacter sp.]
MTSTVVRISSEAARNAAAALRSAGIPIKEVSTLEEARQAISSGEASLALLDAEALAQGGSSSGLGIDAARKLSHDLRTPLSAMAGWLHLIESGKMDDAALKRAIEKLKGNIDDQVRTIDRFLGAHNQEGTRK